MSNNAKLTVAVDFAPMNINKKTTFEPSSIDKSDIRRVGEHTILNKPITVTYHFKLSERKVTFPIGSKVVVIDNTVTLLTREDEGHFGEPDEISTNGGRRRRKQVSRRRKQLRNRRKHTRRQRKH
jgi:hypothetical protein